MNHVACLYTGTHRCRCTESVRSSFGRANIGIKLQQQCQCSYIVASSNTSDSHAPIQTCHTYSGPYTCMMRGIRSFMRRFKSDKIIIMKMLQQIDVRRRRRRQQRHTTMARPEDVCDPCKKARAYKTADAAIMQAMHCTIQIRNDT